MTTNHTNLKTPITISLTNSGKLNEPFLADSYNMQNTLVHEDKHFDSHKGKNANVAEGSLTHLEAYWTQITHDTLGKTTQEAQNHVIGNIGWYIAYIPSTKDRQQTIKKFEKQLNVTFTEAGDSPDKTKWKNK